MGRTAKEKIRKKPNTPGHDLEKSNELYSLLTLCIPFALLSYRVLRNHIKEIL